MKSVLYVAAALMIGASIYGFVDYSKTGHQPEFKAMYNENETAEPVIAEEKMEADIVPVVSIEKLHVTEKEPVKEEIPTGIVSEQKKQGKKIKKKKRINYESFSRAPLREEILNANGR